MLSPRWRKALQDLWLNKTRTVLVIVAIAIGIFGIGSILTSYSILTREMQANYDGTNPASAILTVNNLDSSAVELVQKTYPDVQDIEMRRTIRARIETETDTWRTVLLFVIPDFTNVRINSFTSESGATIPTTGEILIERVALPVIEMEIGDSAAVRTPNGGGIDLKITGTIHDPGLAPAWMEGIAYGYITPETAALLGETDTFNELRIVILDEATNSASLDEELMRQTALAIQADLENAGYVVSHIAVPPPGEHPHNSQLVTLLFLLEAFGVLAFVLSGMLVINLISALLAQQIRQIGTMKAIGARTQQVVGIYLSMVLILGVSALFIAIPLSIGVGQSYAAFAAGMLNFEIRDASIPFWVFGIQILIALLMPTSAALYPIYRSSRVSVQSALIDYGVSENSFGSNLIGRLLGRVRGFGRTYLLALRNTFRQQGRLILTLSTLSIGGAVFMVALNTGASWNKTLDAAFEVQNYDVRIQLNQPYPVTDIEQTLNNIEDVEQFELWSDTTTAFTYTNGTQGEQFMLLAPPPETNLIDLPIIEGRWLNATDTNALVLNHGLAYHESKLAIGDTVRLKINEIEAEWVIVGIVREIGAPELAYINYSAYTDITGTTGLTNHVRLIGQDRSDAGQTALMQDLERAFDTRNIKINSAATMAIQKKVLLDHVLIIVSFLLFMAILVAAVGGLGLMSTMSLNVLERMREIGVMRAIGASALRILQIFIVEGVFVGILSWLIAILLAIPLTDIVGNISSQTFIQSPMILAYSPWGIGLWFLLVIILAAFASAFPALKATELPTHQILAYE